MIAARGAVTRAPDRGTYLIICLAASVAAGVAVARGHQLVIVCLLGVALYAALLLRHPALALLGYVVSRPAVEGFVFVQAGAVTMGQLWGAGLLAVLAVLLCGPLYARGGVPLPIAALVALYAVLAVRGDTPLAVQSGSKLALWLILIVAVERIARTRSGQLLCFRAGYALAVGTALLIGVLIGLNKWGGAFYQAAGAGLDWGTEQSPIPLSFLALFSMTFPLIALLMRWKPFLSLALVFILTVEVTTSYVRTALVALILLMLVYVFVAVRRRRVTAFVLAGAFGVAGLVVQERLATRFSDLSLLTSGQAGGAGSGRIDIWSSVWEATTSSPQTILAGAGAGASNAVSDKAFGLYVDAHNVALEFFATGGLLLVSAYVVFVWWAIMSVRTLHRDRAQSGRARAVGAIGYGVIAAFLVTGSLVSISFYAALVAFALFLGLIRGMALTPGETCFDPVASVARARVPERPPRVVPAPGKAIV